jgi:serine-protein kinase ATM
VIQSVENDVLNIFRIISLMLENYNEYSYFQDFLTENLPKIPSYKFIVALPQLTVRLTNEANDKLSALLKKLLERCALEHPHHTIPLLLAIVNSNADMDKKLKGEEEPRVLGAKILWSRLIRNQSISMIMDGHVKMAAALIDLAYLPLTQNNIPDKHKLLALKNMKYVQCPTVDLPIRKSAKYPSESLNYIIKWSPNVTKVGGINAPKKIECLCSDGVSRSQLLKGKDDMRQDAIMQQIFGVVNQLLMVNKDMKKKQVS